MIYDYAEAMAIYQASSGYRTKAMYDHLKTRGLAGELAVNLFRAHKNSSRAKLYRGRSSKGAAYDTKGWAISNLSEILARAGEELGISWGWKLDAAAYPHCWVIYVDLPAGQISFHNETRGRGPDYAGEWDQVRYVGAERICRYIDGLVDRLRPDPGGRPSADTSADPGSAGPALA